MRTDPATSAGLVTREVRNGSRDGQATKIAVARRTYGTDQADLWDAVTNPERLPRWFMPITGELREGGRYQLEGNAGGVVERCHEPETFAVTWEYGPGVSWLQVTLTPTDDGTTLELVHEAPFDADMWEQFGPGAVGVGWDLALMGLGLHIESEGAPMDPEAAAAWSVSPEGVRFVEQAATGWADAAVAGGDEPDAAREAATRTVAFYTTAPEDEAGACVDGVFEALAVPARRHLLELLAASEQPAGALVTALQERAPISQPAVSQHLRVLRDAGLVSVRAEGRRRLYALDPAGLEAAQAWLARLADPMAPFAQPLDALATEVARGRRTRRRTAAGPDREAGTATRGRPPSATA